MTPKYLLSLSLAALCLLCPIVYAPSGGIGENALIGYVIILSLLGLYGLSQSRTLAQGARERRGQLHPDSLLSPWLFGSWIALAGALLSIIPISLSTLEPLAPFSYESWSTLLTLIHNTQESSSIGTITSPHFSNQLVTLSLSPTHTLRWFVSQLCFIIVVYYSVQARGMRRPILFALILLGPLISLLGITHLLSGASLLFGYIPSLDRIHLTGFVTPLINPNHAASLLMMSLFACLGYYEYLKSDEVDQSKGSESGTRWCLMSVALSLMGLLLSESRAAWGITSALLMLWGLRTKLRAINLRRVLYSLTTLLSLLIPALVMWASQRDRILTEGEIKGKIWLDALPLIGKVAPWGGGRGSFGELFTAYQSFSTTGWVSHAENFVIESAVEGGVIGVLSMTVTIWMWMRWWRAEGIQSHPIAFGLGLGVTAAGIHQQYDFGLDHLNIALPIAVGWGMIWSYQPQEGKPDHVREGRLRRKSRLLSMKTSVWTRYIVTLSLLSGLLVLSTLYMSFVSAPLRAEVMKVDQEKSKQHILKSLMDHPHSAHLHLRSALFDHGNQVDWILRTRRLAPRWAGPLFLEARLLRSLGLDDQAAHMYLKILEERPDKRDAVFKDLFKRELSVLERDWLPSQFWYSYYIQLRQRQRHRAMKFLKSMPTEKVMSDHNLRGLWIKYLIPSCEGEVLHLHDRLEDQVKRKSLSSVVEEIDLITLSAAKVQCRTEKQDLSADKDLILRKFNDHIEKLKNNSEEVIQRKILGERALSNLLKNRVF